MRESIKKSTGMKTFEDAALKMVMVVVVVVMVVVKLEKGEESTLVKVMAVMEALVVSGRSLEFMRSWHLREEAI